MLLPTSRRLAPLGLEAPRVAIRPYAPPVPSLRPDGSVEVRSERVRLDLEARVAGRTLRLASADVAGRVTARVGVADGGIALVPVEEGTEVRVLSVWGAPALGASERQLRATFDVLTGVARQAAVARPVALPAGAVPSTYGLIPTGTSTVGAPGTRALVIDLGRAP